jgi:hypothetical protein
VISLAAPPVVGGDHSVHRPGQVRGLRWAGPADSFSLIDLAQRGLCRAGRGEEAYFDVTAGKTC